MRKKVEPREQVRQLNEAILKLRDQLKYPIDTNWDGEPSYGGDEYAAECERHNRQILNMIGQLAQERDRIQFLISHGRNLGRNRKKTHGATFALVEWALNRLGGKEEASFKEVWKVLCKASDQRLSPIEGVQFEDRDGEDASGDDTATIYFMAGEQGGKPLRRDNAKNLLSKIKRASS